MKSYKSFSGGSDSSNHIPNPVTLKQTVLVGSRFILEILHYYPLQSLHFLVCCSSRF